jgi:protein-glutamine gamma-glutamyltransferase
MTQMMDAKPQNSGCARTLLYGVALFLIPAGIFLEMWVLFAFAILSAFLARQLGRRKATREPEDSAALRRIAFGAQTVGILALTSTTQLWGVGLVSIAMLALGHACAYRYRRKPPFLMRAGAFILLHLAFAWMFYGLFNGQPYPQSQVAMLAIGAVSFELFSRMNLTSGMGMGLVNLYVAATLSRDYTFGLFLVSFLGLVLMYMWQADSEDGLKGNPVVLRPVVVGSRGQGTLSRTRGAGLRFALMTMIAAPLVFAVSPHFAGHPIIPPVTLQVPIRRGPSAEIINPALPLVQVQGWSNEESEYYTGFSSSLDLSYRGGLSDTVMMFVRSPAVSYWRSHAYDYYDGRTWSQSDSSVRIITRKGAVIPIAEDGTWLGKDYFVQTYTIAQPMPNLVFIAGDPIDLYIGADQVAMDSTGGIHVGEALKPGMIYSVLSLRQEHSPDELRRASTEYPTRIMGRYLQVPENITGRTRELARQLTRSGETTYDKVVAVRDYLQQTYPYYYFPPPQAPNSEAIDQFLFVDQRGICEHFASAMVVLLREAGIPTRLAAGFGSGDYNTFTGYYEVRANDAHAWVEVYFPSFGWVPFDPTPGWNGSPQTGTVQHWAFSNLLADMQLPSIPLGDVAHAGAAVLGLAIKPLLIVGVAVGLAVIGWLLWKQWEAQAAQAARRRFYHDPARKRIFAAYRKAQRELRSYRGAAQTVREHARAERRLADLAKAVEIAAYRPKPPDAKLVQWVEQRKQRKG